MWNRVTRAWRYCRRIYESFDRHFGGLMAAAASFFALLSVIPLLSVAVAILGWIVGSSEDALLSISGSIRAYIPTDTKVIRGTLVEIHRDTTWLGSLGLAGLLISGSAIFTNLEIAFNNIWGVPVMRHWLKQRLVAIGTSTLILLLLFLSIGMTSVLTYLQNVSVPGTEVIPGRIPQVRQALAYTVAILFSVMLFTLIYKVIPNKPIQWREALIGGAFSGMAFEMAKYFFALYLARFNNYNKVYGSLGSLVALIIWTYYSMTIVFLGAEIAADAGTKLPAAEQEGLHHPMREVEPGDETPHAWPQGEGPSTV